MSKQPRSQLLVAAKASLQNPMNFDAFLEKLSPKDRLNVTRHVEACEATGDPLAHRSFGGESPAG